MAPGFQTQQFTRKAREGPFFRIGVFLRFNEIIKPALADDRRILSLSRVGAVARKRQEYHVPFLCWSIHRVDDRLALLDLLQSVFNVLFSDFRDLIRQPDRPVIPQLHFRGKRHNELERWWIGFQDVLQGARPIRLNAALIDDLWIQIADQQIQRLLQDDRFPDMPFHDAVGCLSGSEAGDFRAA